LLGAISTTPSIVDDSISTDIDADIYRFTVVSGQVVDFNINTPFNDSRGLGSYLRLFNAQGVELAFNNDAAAPGESQIGFDSYLRHTFAAGGTYYVGVSNGNNIQYDPLAGNGDTAGGPYSIGAYQLIVEVFPPTLFVTTNLASIPEINGSAIGTVARNSGDVSFSLLVTLSSSDTNVAMVTENVVIPANQLSATFTIVGVDDHVVDGAKTVTITASASGYVEGTRSLQVTDSDGSWHNAANPSDVNNDGVVSPIDALLIINYLNLTGPGSVPAGNPPPYLDVNSDNFISPIDALLIINRLNSPPVGAGEGEAPATPTRMNAENTAVASPLTAAMVDEAHAQSDRLMSALDFFRPPARTR
jgi:hypothetical protein